MKAFEYRILSFPQNHKNSLTDMQSRLTQHGLAGWEVVSVSTSEFAHVGHTAFLKREVIGIDASGDVE